MSKKKGTVIIIIFSFLLILGYQNRFLGNEYLLYRKISWGAQGKVFCSLTDYQVRGLLQNKAREYGFVLPFSEIVIYYHPQNYEKIQEIGYALKVNWSFLGVWNQEQVAVRLFEVSCE